MKRAVPLETIDMGGALDLSRERPVVLVCLRASVPSFHTCDPAASVNRVAIAPRHMPGTDLWTTVWVADDSVSSDGIGVDSHVIWGALDCPAGFAVAGYGIQELEFFPALTDVTADLHRTVPVDKPLAVIGWMIDRDDRRINGATAIFDEEGNLLASAYAQHAPVPIDFASD